MFSITYWNWFQSHCVDLNSFCFFFLLFLFISHSSFTTLPSHTSSKIDHRKHLTQCRTWTWEKIKQFRSKSKKKKLFSLAEEFHNLLYVSNRGIYLFLLNEIDSILQKCSFQFQFLSFAYKFIRLLICEKKKHIYLIHVIDY